MADSGPQVLRYFCNHLVGICFNVIVKDKSGNETAQSEVWSATYIEIDTRRYLLTAGHCVADFKNFLSRGHIQSFNTYIIDSLGSEARNPEPIPFDYEAAPKTYTDSEDADYALIELRAGYHNLLDANGVIPITEEHWKRQHAINYTGFVLLGFPAEKTSIARSSNSQIETQFEPTLIPLRPAECSVENAHSDKRFSAYVPLSSEIFSIKGMSGGPVVGFAERNGLRYWIMAIQSSWFRGRRQLYACRLPEIVRHFRRRRQGY